MVASPEGDNNSVHYHVEGKGKPVLLIHGWTMQSGVWDDFVKDFSERYKIITLDLRGHGKSVNMEGPYSFTAFARDIVGLIHKLGLEDLTLVGWSMGVSIILRMLDAAAPYVDSLVLISGNPSLIKRPDYCQGIHQIMAKRLLRQTSRDYSKGLESFYKMLFTPEEFASLQESGKYSMITDENLVPLSQAAIESLTCLIDEDLRLELAKTDLPTLVIHGSRDSICAPDAAHYMQKTIPGSKILFLEEAGHVPFITRKAEVHNAVEKFLRGIG